MDKLPIELAVSPSMVLYMPQTERHAEAIYEAIIETLPSLQERFIWANPAPTFEDIHLQVALWQKIYAKEQAEEHDRHTWMILNPGYPDTLLLGIISLTKIKDGGYEFGYWVRKNAQGRGIVSQAIRGILTQIPASYFLIRCAEDNAASKAIAAKFGFTYRYTQKDALKWPNGKTRDMCAFIRD